MRAPKRNKTVDEGRKSLPHLAVLHGRRWATMMRRYGKQARHYSDLRVTDLKAIAKERKIPGYSKMTKEQLINALLMFIAQPQAPKPITTERRMANYRKQNHGRPFTPRQKRQLRRMAEDYPAEMLAAGVTR